MRDGYLSADQHAVWNACRVDLLQSTKLADVCYDIRGPVLVEAKRLEEAGHRILKLNIGNSAPFGFSAPDEILVDVIRNLPDAEGYSDSQGILSARTAIVQHYQARGLDTVHVDDVWLGNGVSELITMTLQALLNDGDEVLIPAPDYPLWTGITTLSDGRPVHYLCDEANGWGHCCSSRPSAWDCSRPSWGNTPTGPRPGPCSTRRPPSACSRAWAWRASPSASPRHGPGPGS